MTPEAKVAAEIKDYLTKTGRFFIRINSGKVKVSGGWMQLAPKGTADMLTFDHAGKCVWIETKHAKGVQSDEQIDFEMRVRLLGHTFILARCLDDVMEVLR